MNLGIFEIIYVQENHCMKLIYKPPYTVFPHYCFHVLFLIYTSSSMHVEAYLVYFFTKIVQLGMTLDNI